MVLGILLLIVCALQFIGYVSALLETECNILVFIGGGFIVAVTFLGGIVLV
jgi:hypothetical protein